MPQVIELTQGQRTLVDDDTFSAVGHLKWCAARATHRSRPVFYAVTSALLDRAGRPVRLHRLILGLQPGDPRKGDHKNLDTLDNQRSNLRIASNGQNIANQTKQARNTSGYKGV